MIFIGVKRVDLTEWVKGLVYVQSFALFSSQQS
jgi:hypothetical protein